jgi:hypothetical protein
MAKAKIKAGRPKVDKGLQKLRIPISAAQKTHSAIVEKFKEPIERFEKKLIKELDQ